MLVVLGALRVRVAALDCVVTDSRDPPLDDEPSTGLSTLRWVMLNLPLAQVRLLLAHVHRQCLHLACPLVERHASQSYP